MILLSCDFCAALRTGFFVNLFFFLMKLSLTQL